MNILVVGNGFDLAHNMKTHYEEFLDFADHIGLNIPKPNDQTMQYIETMNPIFQSRSPIDKTSLANEFVGMIYYNHLLNYFIQVFKQRGGKNKGWIDFEKEISVVVQALDSVRRRILDTACPVKVGDVEKERAILKQILILFQTDENLVSLDDIEKIKKETLDYLNRITRALEIYLIAFIPYPSNDIMPFIKDLHIDHVLSFNYTETYAKLYKAEKCDFDYIHGKAERTHNVSTCNLVLGIDEYQTGTDRDNDNAFIQFKKFYQRIYKQTGCHYVDWLNLHDNKNIYIIGHSLDITDKDVFRKLILSANAHTTIYYHNQEALGNLIANLVKILGEDEVIKRTDGKNSSIRFAALTTDG